MPHCGQRRGRSRPCAWRLELPLAPALERLHLALGGFGFVLAVALLEQGLLERESLLRGRQRHRLGDAPAELARYAFDGRELPEAAGLLDRDAGGEVGARSRRPARPAGRAR